MTVPAAMTLPVGMATPLTPDEALRTARERLEERIKRDTQMCNSVEWGLKMAIDALEEVQKSEATTDEGTDALTIAEAAMVHRRINSALRSLRIAHEAIQPFRRA